MAFNCSECEWRRNYYLKQVEKLEKLFNCKQFFMDGRLEITDFLIKAKHRGYVISQNSSTAQKFRFSFFVGLPLIARKVLSYRKNGLFA
jgi:hypothetical protein